VEEAKHPQTQTGRGGLRSSRARLVIVIVTLVVAAVGALVVFTQVGKDDVTTEKVIATLRVNGSPNGLAVGPDALWVALNDQVGSFDAKLERLNLTSGTVEASVPLRGVLTDTRKVGTSLWTTRLNDWLDRKPGELVELDWDTGQVQGRIAFARTPFRFAVGNGSMWVVVGRNPATLVRIDPETRKAVGAPVTISPNRVIGLEYGLGAIWASEFENGTLVRIDPTSGRSVRVKVGTEPVGIAIVDGYVWVANRESGTVSRVDPKRMQVVDTVDAGTYPTWISAAGDSLWVSNQGDGTLTRIDPQTARTIGPPIKIADPVEVGAAHVQAVSRDSLWVASISARTLSRIDTTAQQ
jgi:YVTN family beta-propeller protein